MEKKQKIIVGNKGQLIAAVGCAIGFPGITEIILQREKWRTFYKFNGLFKSYQGMQKYNWRLRKCRNAIRHTPAECFN